jgi:hypothetical protein
MQQHEEAVSCPWCKEFDLSFLYRWSSIRSVWPLCSDCGWELYVDEDPQSRYPNQKVTGLSIAQFEKEHKDVYKLVIETKKSRGRPW